MNPSDYQRELNLSFESNFVETFQEYFQSPKKTAQTNQPTVLLMIGALVRATGQELHPFEGGTLEVRILEAVIVRVVVSGHRLLARAVWRERAIAVLFLLFRLEQRCVGG